ncbi:MAG: hypothetical protein Kow0029_25090 [Candidatus Rifleibacteriota bacterium]
MKIEELKLPKLVESSPEINLIKDILTKSQRKLWNKSKLSVPLIPASEKILRTLQLEHRKGRIIRGYELIDRNLSAEKKGLMIVDDKTAVKRGQRVSRLLIISNDGAERYYRKIENLIFSHFPRVLPVMIDADSHLLGESFFGEGKAVKVMMLEHKESVSTVLLSLAKVAQQQRRTGAAAKSENQ